MLKIKISIQTKDAEYHFYNNDGTIWASGNGNEEGADKIREVCEQANDLIINALKEDKT